MKKIILAVVLSSLLPAIAVAKDEKHQMRNDNPNPSASVMEGKHMMSNSTSARSSAMKGKHMMNDNPNASHPSKRKAENKNGQESRKYSVVPYEE